MTADTERSVELSRTGKAAFRATNVRGGTLDFGEGNDADFTPVELLLVAIAGCSAIDVDYLVGKRVEPSSFDLSIRADKIRDDLGNRLTDIRLTFDLTFPGGAEGDHAKEILPRAVAQSHDRLCTVTRTVVVGTPVESVIAD
ncbi:putative OsmC-like protein [Aeromicrobium panaciterrae]|uniref:OsmC-like protein n=1 Tax=Aeromicrobium panaciterrae TaxID=363861 RepID=A0ABU1UK91_9ACTN|nr:OsmC family protein [Aeromicrobium panaciterrae]MDR7085597.1 putative OsmC-like protein [Aeromicrobium panaciterrae]